MPVSGLILRLREGMAGVSGLAALRLVPEITLGEPTDRWLPIAFHGRDPEHCRQLHEQLSRLDGVEVVEVVCVHWEDDEVPSPVETHGSTSNPSRS